MNEHDLHSAFGDLARRGADAQADRLRHGAGLSAAEITRRAGRTRRLRTTATAVTGVAAVAGLVLAGSALAERPDPQPADTPTITHPTPAPTSTPAPSDAPTTTAPDPVTDPATSETSGMLRPYPTAPSVAWTASVDTWWTASEPGQIPVLGDVAATSHLYTGPRALGAAGAWLLAIGAPPFDEHLVGVDAMTGGARWTWLSSGPDRVLSCAGVHDGLLVCQGVENDAPVVQLRDPASGAVVRTVAPGGNGIAVAGGAVVVHSAVGAAGTDVDVRVYDLASGELRSAITLPGYIDPDTPEGDLVVWPETAGSLVLLHGVTYELALDTRTGAVLAQGMRPAGVRADGWVFATAPDGTAHGIGSNGADVPLPGAAAGTPGVWAPDAGLDVPLLTWSDSGDGRADVVSAVDSGSGDILWSVPGTSVVQAVVGRTAVLRGDDDLVGVDVRTGAELWRTAASDAVGFDGQRLVLAVVGGGLRALAADDGAEAWSLELDPGQSALAVDGTLLLHGDDLSVSALVP
ncbi:outer membrane protein assembly factor BamB family protein [Cellulomonas sp. Marseille-Q8402]